MINLLILTLIVLATSVVNAFIDSYLIKKYWGKIKNLNHTSRSIIRFIVFGLAIYFLYRPEIHLQENVWQILSELKKPFVADWYCGLLFNVTFDLLLNKLRNRPWNYQGRDAATDQLHHLINERRDISIDHAILIAKLLVILNVGLWILSM